MWQTPVLPLQGRQRRGLLEGRGCATPCGRLEEVYTWPGGDLGGDGLGILCFFETIGVCSSGFDLKSLWLLF